MATNEISPLNVVGVDSDKRNPASHPPEAMESGGTAVKQPPGAYPPGAYPPGAYPPGAYPPGALPPGALPPGAYPPGLTSPPVLIPNCPPGLEYLAQVDQLLVHQQLELLEVLIGFETNNKYQIKNSIGQPIYFAAENTDVCTRMCCGNMRPFEMKILSNLGQVVMTLYRPLKCMCCCCPCCLQELEVHGSSGEPLGYIIQDWHPFLPKFTVQNERKEPVLKIDGPCCPCSCMGDVDFLIKNLDETETIGKISKQWMGIAREMFTDADNFGIQFPMDLDLKMKAVMLGACFLIDFMFFEKQQ